jgi:cyclopropane fatty-acyl-phospholipid synthase-like methyltransferase
VPGDLMPHFDDVQAHYDLSDAYFERDDVTLEEGQIAKIDLDQWARDLQAHRDEAVAIQSDEVYQRYMEYLTGCANAFRTGYIDVNQFTLKKPKGMRP